MMSSEGGLTVLADPAAFIHRRFGIHRARRSRCHTFLLDPAKIVRIQLIHDACDISRLIGDLSEAVSQQRQVASPI
jgi:alkyl hydroperoxide reductase subunit AhpC